MGTACSQSPVFGLYRAPVLHISLWRALRVDELAGGGPESKNARMKSGWDGFVAAKETLPE
jgi:hypothetical protein